MRYRHSWICCAAALLACICYFSPAVSSAQLVDAKPVTRAPVKPGVARNPASAKAWSGVWTEAGAVLFAGKSLAEAGENHGPNANALPEDPPLLPVAREKFLAAVERSRAPRTQEQAASESHFEGCDPPSMPSYMMPVVYPIEIIIHDTGLYFISTVAHETVRRVYTDGRPHPPEEDYVFNPMGHSIGKWEGNVLVIDTVYMTAGQIDRYVDHSDKLRVTERIRLVDGNTLVNEMTLVDPEVFAKPWTTTFRYTRQPGMEMAYNPCLAGERNF